jgi:hypothetical protein
MVQVESNYLALAWRPVIGRQKLFPVERDLITCFAGNEPVSPARVKPFDLATKLRQGTVGNEAGWALHRKDYPGPFPFE